MVQNILNLAKLGFEMGANSSMMELCGEQNGMRHIRTSIYRTIGNRHTNQADGGNSISLSIPMSRSRSTTSERNFSGFVTSRDDIRYAEHKNTEILD